MLNIVNCSSALPPGSLEPFEGLTVCPDPQLSLISQFMQNTELFSFLAMDNFAKIVNTCSCFHKLFLQYQLFTFSTFFNKSLFLLQNESLFFTPEVLILHKKVY